MFITVKDLTHSIDNMIKVVNDNKAIKDTVDKVVYDECMESWKRTAFRRLEKLKQISCNKKLIDKYEKAIINLFD